MRQVSVAHSMKKRNPGTPSFKLRLTAANHQLKARIKLLKVKYALEISDMIQKFANQKMTKDFYRAIKAPFGAQLKETVSGTQV